MSSETIWLEIDDADVLRPIKVFDIAYTEWCQNKGYNIGDDERLKDFKKILHESIKTIKAMDLSLMDPEILRWCGIFLIACEDWRPLHNPSENLCVFASKVFEILDHFNLKVGEEKFLRIRFYDPKAPNMECIIEGLREIKYKIKLCSNKLSLEEIYDGHVIIYNEELLARLGL